MPRGPSRRSRKKPTTVGGSTMGNVSTQSSAPLSIRGARAMAYAAKMPVKKVMTVEISAMRSEFTSGNQSMAYPPLKNGAGT